MARPADADWLTAGADDWKRQTYARSSPPSTEEHNLKAPIVTPSLYVDTLMDVATTQL